MQITHQTLLTNWFFVEPIFHIFTQSEYNYEIAQSVLSIALLSKHIYQEMKDRGVFHVMKCLKKMYNNKFQDWYISLDKLKPIGFKFLATTRWITIDRVRQNNCFALRRASTNGYVNVVRYFLNLGITSQDIRSDNYATLNNAMCYGRLEILRLLLSNIDISLIDLKYNDNILFINSIKSKQFEIVKFLLDKGFGIEDIRKQSCRVLKISIKTSTVEIIKLLLETGITVQDLRDCQVFYIINRWDKDVYKLFYTINGITAQDIRNNYVLENAVTQNWPDLVEKIISINGIGSQDAKICLLSAVNEHKDSTILKMLLNVNGIDINVIREFDCLSQTILNNDCVDIIQTLANINGFDVVDLRNNNYNALKMAIAKRNEETIRILVNVNGFSQKDLVDSNAIQIANSRNNQQVMNVLIDAYQNSR